MTMITPSYLGETIEYSSLHACRSTLEDPTDNTWYSACIERNEDAFMLTTSGDFKWGGQQTYVGTIPLRSVYAAGAGVPDFFMFGDPHNNYYRGSVYYDDIKLETWQEH